MSLFKVVEGFFRRSLHPTAAHSAAEAGARQSQVPLAHLRPDGISGSTRRAQPPTAAEAAAMERAYGEQSQILASAEGRPLKLREIEELVRRTNPSASTTNCPEVALAVRQNLEHRRPAVAAPGIRSPIDLAGAQFDAESPAAFHELLKRELHQPGMNGIVSGNRSATVEGHLYNAANVDGEIKYICGQTGGGIVKDQNIFPGGDFYRLYL
ncbi:toxin glutamine deamidase domain-containing protein [Actinoallomurus iriomotensis]|uniref:Tox-PL domain-containing protein n=1 Tax=Actinoallomurus iriomotensis TaxID=478107 RepID=A0A9W6RRH7_9ACTN|nr:hypothetical protein [Actinoallomurus iriomotensis]GLY78625.1 hypothetical protein Airi01_068920 [Actinoallomurus iriomotensis]